jgi:hypothetical protein
MSDVEKFGKKALNIATLGMSDALFSSPDMPEVKDPAVAPDPESLESKRKAERDMARRKSSGRTSTILSESNTLG